MAYYDNPEEGEILHSLLQSNKQQKLGEEQLFNIYSHLINEGIGNYSLTQGEAFEVYSNTILLAIDNIINGSFDVRSSLKIYIYQLFSNKCEDFLRIKRSISLNLIKGNSSLTNTYNYIEKCTEKSEGKLLKEGFEQLSEPCRTILLLSADGHTDKEIASILGYKTADVVKTSRIRCINRIKQLITGKHKEEESTNSVTPVPPPKQVTEVVIVDEVMKGTGLNINQLAAFTNITSQALKEYSITKKKLGKREHKKLIKILDVYRKGKVIFGSVDAFVQWLNLSSVGLGGKKPFDLMHTPEGLDLIMEELFRIEYGALA